MSDILENLIELTSKQLSKQEVAYLKSRNIQKQTAQKWKIGYLSSESQLLSIEGDREILYNKGILLRVINRSPLHHYLIFPMYDQYNRLIAISGRPPISNQEVKQRGLKKYWHSRFNKRKFLFGLNHALEKIREENYVIIAEGQFDTIAASQAGIENIVSTCGTALTEDHIIILSRYTDKAYVVFDTDEAGLQAFAQLEKYAKKDLELIPVFLPDSVDEQGIPIKEDPDSFIRKYGKDKFLEVVLKK